MKSQNAQMRDLLSTKTFLDKSSWPTFTWLKGKQIHKYDSIPHHNWLVQNQLVKNLAIHSLSNSFEEQSDEQLNQGLKGLPLWIWNWNYEI